MEKRFGSVLHHGHRLHETISIRVLIVLLTLLPVVPCSNGPDLAVWMQRDEPGGFIEYRPYFSGWNTVSRTPPYRTWLCLARKSKIFRCHKTRRHMSMMILLLVLSGDVEMNPGPLTGRNQQQDNETGQSRPLSTSVTSQGIPQLMDTSPTSQSQLHSSVGGPMPGLYGPMPGLYGPMPGLYGPMPGLYGPMPGLYGQPTTTANMQPPAVLQQPTPGTLQQHPVSVGQQPMSAGQPTSTGQPPVSINNDSTPGDTAAISVSQPPQQQPQATPIVSSGGPVSTASPMPTSMLSSSTNGDNTAQVPQNAILPTQGPAQNGDTGPPGGDAWQSSIQQNLRDHLIRRMLHGIYPVQNIDTMNTQYMMLVAYFKKMEVHFFYSCRTKDEYFSKLAEMYRHVQAEINRTESHPSDESSNPSPKEDESSGDSKESAESHPSDELGSPSPKEEESSGDSKESEPGKSREERTIQEDSLYIEVKRALEKGAVDVKIIKCMTLGPPEAGKTQLKHALLGDFTPINESTDASTQATPAVEIMVAGEKKWELLNFKQLLSAMQTAATKEDLPMRPTNEDTQSNSESIPEVLTPADVNPLHEDDPLHKDNALETKVSTHPSQATYIDHFRKLKGKVMETIHRSQSSDAEINIHGAKLIYTVDNGGQPSFLDFHPVTATFAATYLLLYNMEEGLDAKPKMTYRKDYPTKDLPNSTQSNLEILRRSLFTLHHFKERYREKHERLTSLMQNNFKPPRDDPYIIIVGTRRNEATLKEDKRKLKSEYMRIPSVEEVVKTHFVDSRKRNSKEIEDLRNLVCTDATSCSFRLPLSWFQLHLMCLASESGTVPERIPGNFTFSELCTVCLGEELVSSDKEFKAMVTVFHSLGVFSCPDLDLEEKEVEESEILIFVDPSLLFANVTKILEISFRTFNKQSLIKLQRSGELTTKALEDLGIPDTLGSYQGFHKRLLKWLVHWGLAAEMKEEKEEKKWFIPSVLRPRSNPSEPAISKTPFEPFPLSICFLPESPDDFTFHYLPEGLFPHFIVQLVKIGYILPKNTLEEDPEEDECAPRTRCRDSMSLRSKRKNKPAFNIDLIDKASHLVVDLSPANKKLPRNKACSEAAAILVELKEVMEKVNKNLYHHNSASVTICCTCTCELKEDHLAEVQEQLSEICCLHFKRLRQGAWQGGCDEPLKEVLKCFHSFSDVEKKRKCACSQHGSSSSKKKKTSSDSEESGIITDTSEFLPYIEEMTPHLTQLGAVLGIYDFATATVEACGNLWDKCLKILNHWINVTPNPTWKSFCKELENKNTFNNLRAKIEKDHYL